MQDDEYQRCAQRRQTAALPVMTRLIFDPAIKATMMSSGEYCTKVRRPAMRIQATPNAKSNTARTQSASCQRPHPGR